MRLVGDPREIARAQVMGLSLQPAALRPSGMCPSSESSAPLDALLRGQRVASRMTIRLYAWKNGYAVFGADARMAAQLMDRVTITHQSGAPFIWFTYADAEQLQWKLLNAGCRVVYYEHK